MTKRFVEAVRKSEVAMRPILPLAQPLDLGHVGTVSDDGVYSQKGTIKTMLGLNSMGPELPVQDKDLNISVTSGKDVKVGFRANAKTDGSLSQFANLKAKASISFGRENGFFLAIRGMTIRQLQEPEALNLAILRSYDMGFWQKDWVFVHQIGIAEKLTVVMASEADTTVLVSGSGKATASAAASVDLAAGFKFVASTKAVTQITGAKNMAAFYGAYRVRDTWLSPAKVERFKLVAPAAFGLELSDYPMDAHDILGPASKMYRPV